MLRDARLLAWVERTKEYLHQRWWLWPLLLVEPLLHHRILAFVNDFLDSHTGTAFRLTKAAVMHIPSEPIVWAALLSLIVLLGLVIHAYFDVRKTEEKPPEASLVVAASHEDAREEPMASIESVLLLRVLYKDYLERTFTLACEFFWGDLYPNLRVFVGHLIKEHILPRYGGNKSILDEKLIGRGGFTNSDFTDSVLRLFRGTLLDYIRMVGVI
jgi:hypothetical protein